MMRFKRNSIGAINNKRISLDFSFEDDKITHSILGY